MIKVLVLGSTGMAGHIITAYLEGNKNIEVFNLSRKNKLNDNTIIMDVTDLAAFNNLLDSRAFDFIVNSTGILNQFAEDLKKEAVLVNSYIPHFLEDKFKCSNTRIIHISTDCVFSGKTGSYTETSFRDGDSFYARTKAVGEIVNDKDLTIRTSVIGPDLDFNGIGLFNWFMKTKGEIKGYTNVLWTGVTNLELAKAIEALIYSPLVGLYHLVPEVPINKYDLLKLFKSTFNKEDIIINKDENVHSDKSLVNTRKDFNYPIPPYNEMLEDIRQWMFKHKELYPHYFL